MFKKKGVLSVWLRRSRKSSATGTYGMDRPGYERVKLYEGQASPNISGT